MCADSFVRRASCLSVSIRCSDPARSTRVREPAWPAGIACLWMPMRQIACERDEASCTPVAAVERMAEA
eukprot:3558254-Pleurochrysis_carterae.AAC.1